jgi:cytochrome c-type biogenesis protein CcmH/NrfG
MADTNRSLFRPWTRSQALLLSVLCLLAGIAGGWLIRGSQIPAPTTSPKAASLSPPAAMGASPMPAPTRLKEMAGAQAAPLLNKLKSDPANPDLLAGIGNLYYDAREYPTAVDYYQRALQAKPSDVAVRTDLGTAYWFMGNADSALAEFNRALTYAPNNPNTLFNRGLVKWKGKMDSAGAIADWEKLLAANPNYEQKKNVEQMIAEARQQTALEPGMKAK